jgi:hypothetical protein
MGTRYTMLRASIANLAAAPDMQVAYLDRSFATLTGGHSAARYGNNELVLEFDDIFPAAEHMLEYGEITPSEIGSIKPLDRLIEQLCEEADETFWKREALFADVRWQQLRSCASEVLSALPDEQRESDYTRGLTSNAS